MRFLALDLSLSDTGAVVFEDGQPVSQRAIKPPAEQGKGIGRVAWIAAQVWDLVRDEGIEQVVIEGYSYGSEMVAHQLGELGGTVRYVLYMRRIPFDVIAPGAWKKAACGKGTLNKAMARLEIYKRYGFEANDENIIDAFGVGMGWWLLKTETPKPKIPRRRKVAA